MRGPIIRAGVRVLVSVVLGAALGALYAGLVGAVHLGTYGRWDQFPAFAVGSVLVGAGLGLLGRVAWAMSGQAARERADGRPPPSVSPDLYSPRCAAEAGGKGRGPQPGRPCDHMAGGEAPRRSRRCGR